MVEVEEVEKDGTEERGKIAECQVHLQSKIQEADCEDWSSSPGAASLPCSAITAFQRRYLVMD